MPAFMGGILSGAPASSPAGVAASRRDPYIESPLTIRSADGSITPEYAVIRMSFGFPPGGGTPPGQMR